MVVIEVKMVLQRLPEGIGLRKMERNLIDVPHHRPISSEFIENVHELVNCVVQKRHLWTLLNKYLRLDLRALKNTTALSIFAIDIQL